MSNIYESELVYKLMERDGLNIPSSVPPYEAEIKAYLIEQVKLAYPKLNDYEAEWLLYNYTKHLPAEFPLETITNVTDATVNNVVPYAYKSAILSGQTLVNVVWECRFTSKTSYFEIELNQYQIGQSYMFIMFDAPSNITELYVGNAKGTIVWRNYTNNFVRNKNCIMLKITCPSTYDGTSVLPHLRYLNDEQPSTINNIKCMLIKYQEGMENWDIPYFEGMKSVQMPVLKITGKNLFDIVKVFKETNTKYDIGDDESYFFNVEIKHYNGVFYPNTNKKLTISYEAKNGTATNFRIGFVYTDGSYQSATNITSTTEFEKRSITSYSNKIVKFIKFDFTKPGSVYIKDVQLEEADTATSYEPYKSNILTVNEEVELRGIGEAQDTLDCLTGEIIESIGEGVLNGSEEWLFNAPKEQANHWCFHNPQKLAEEKLLISDRFPQSDIDGDTESIRGGGDFIFVFISKEKVEGNANSFKQWLSQNPIKYQYRKSEKSVKTVDLSIVDENGNEINYFMPIEGTMHIQTAGEPIKPTVSMGIPVEATTQNLASFIEMEV